MSKRVRRRRGTRAEHDEFTGADGEITVNTTDYRVHVHDGATAGGVTTAREDEVLHKDQNLSDVDSAATSRTNLGLGTAATKSANQNLRTTDGVTFGSVSAGNLGTAAEREANQNLRTTDDVTFKSVTTSQDNWTATAEPTVNDDNTAGYVVGSRWYYAGGSPHVQWVCVDASTGAADWVPVQERYESQTVELGGDFGTSQVHLLRRGDLVALISDGTLTHTTAEVNGKYAAQSGFSIPTAYRPVSAVATSKPRIADLSPLDYEVAMQVMVFSNGVLVVSYESNHLDTGDGSFSITYSLK